MDIQKKTRINARKVMEVKKKKKKKPRQKKRKTIIALAIFRDNRD